MSGAAVERYRVYEDGDLLPLGPLLAGQVEVVLASAHDAAIAALTAELQQCRQALESIRVFAQDCIENGHDRGQLGNLYSIRDLCDRAALKERT